ncbi:MAG: hypothetical protein QN149_13125 [Armatimonadota bacterium]|nr:hypothetical protein [Armatimonadota bacterium]MDR7468112.1 hypothetical protein [Armatimonadota bacterium]MDR7494682.1 hypothetical protein [Armatimonadota bacterium]MDR7500228.1 hypothetical protein [Armatimonadota bacterium]MDR7505608.1 hypothetical protein [Armatimonadota bacterium]
MRYHSPTIEDYGKIDQFVHNNIGSPPNSEDPAGSDPQVVPTFSGGGGGAGGSGLALLGLAGLAGLFSARGNQTLPAADPGKTNEEEILRTGKFD